MQYRYFLTLMLITMSFVVYSQQITLVNPIMKGFYPDPSIVKAGTDYYLIHSTFSYFPGIPVMHSKDLKNWKQIGNVIHRPSQMNFLGEKMTRGLFAPAISYHNGIYYVTCTDIDNDGNFVVTASDPSGPWSDPVKIPEVRGIDPSIYFDKLTDKAYILYNSDAPDNKPLYSGHRTIRMYEFDYKRLKVVGEEQILVNGGVDISTKPVWIEAPHIIQKYGWYYLYAAEGGTSVNHSEVVLRSKSVWGPYIPYENNPILTQRHLPEDRNNPITSTGHAEFVEGPDGNTYAVFLAVRPYEGDFYNTGRETFIAPVKWINEWPVINPDHEEVQYFYNAKFPEIAQEDALPHSGNFEYTLHFKKELHPTLLFMRTIDENSFALSETEGLQLKLKPETIMEYKNPSFIGLRQQHLKSSAEVELTFNPSGSNEKAGLVIFQDEFHFYYICKSIIDEKEVIQLFKSTSVQNEMELLAQKDVNSPKVYLKITSNGDKYSFYFAESQNKYSTLMADVDGKFLSTKVAGGFIGCLYGMYATSSGFEGGNIATFKYLKYQGNDDIYNK